MEHSSHHQLKRQNQKLTSKVEELRSKNRQVEAECKDLKCRDATQCRTIKYIEDRNKSLEEHKKSLKKQNKALMEQNNILVDRCNDDVTLRRENRKLKEDNVRLLVAKQTGRGHVSNACRPRVECDGFVMPDDEQIDPEAEYQECAGGSDSSDVDESSSEGSDADSDITIDEAVNTTAPRARRSDKQHFSTQRTTCATTIRRSSTGCQTARTSVTQRSANNRQTTNARSAAQPTKKKRRHAEIEDDDELIQDMREASIQPGLRAKPRAQRKQNILAKRKISRAYRDYPELSD